MSRAQRGAVVLLLLAMALAQVLGLVHRTMHAQALLMRPGLAAVAVAVAATRRAAAADAQAGVPAHEPGPDCHLYDTLVLDAPPPAAVLVLAAACPGWQPVVAPALTLQQRLALYHARGPPIAA